MHRIGRTARAKSKGMAVTLVCPDDMFKFGKIEQLIDRVLEKEQPPAEIGEGPQWGESSKGGRALVRKANRLKAQLTRSQGESIQSVRLEQKVVAQRKHLKET